MLSWSVNPSMEQYPTESLADASPSIFDAQLKPSDKAIKAMEEWRDSEADSELESEWCDAVIQALKDGKQEEW